MSEVSDATPVAESAPVSEDAVVETEVSAEEVAAEEADLAAEEAKKAAVVSSKKKFTPKVNGKQKEIELDLSNDEEVLKYLSKALAADEKFEEAANLRKSVESLVNQLRSDPRSVLSHPDLGLDLKKFAEGILNEEIEEMAKSPEQKELEKLRRELEEKTKREQELENQKREAEMARLQEQAFKQFDDEITNALTTSNLPKSPYVVKRIADTLIEAINMGYTEVQVKDVLPIIEQQISNEIQKMFEVMPEEVMEKMLGKQNIDRMRKSRLAKMKKSPAGQKVQDTGAKKEDPLAKKEKNLSFKDVFGRF